MNSPEAQLMESMQESGGRTDADLLFEALDAACAAMDKLRARLESFNNEREIYNDKNASASEVLRHVSMLRRYRK